MQLHTAALILTATILAGCGQSTNNLTKLNVGMDKSAVVSILGSPQSVAAQGNAEVWTYTLSNSWNNAVWNEEYYVRMVGGRVVSFGR